MIKHKIYIYKSPKSSDRIAYIDSIDVEKSFEKTPESFIQLCKHHKISTHRLVTDSKSIKSIINLDPFFKGIVFYEDVEVFSEKLEEISQKSLPSPLEFAENLLTQTSLDKLKLQKVLYLIYCACLDKGVKIFNQSPVAYKYGPVFEDVYREYSDVESKKTIPGKISIENRFLISKMTKPELTEPIIDDILERVGHKSGGNLIDITHVKDGPWHKVYIPGANIPIDDNTILNHNHKVTKLI